MSIFVILYDNTYPITPVIRNNYWHRAEGTPAISGASANPHFIGRFTGYLFNNPVNSGTSDGLPQAIDTEGIHTHFIGKFNPYNYQRVKYSPANDVAVAVTVETNPHFIGKFRGYNYNRPINSWTIDGNPQVIDNVGANPHFVSKYKAAIYNRIIFYPGAQDTSTIIPPDNTPNFIGKFTQYRYNKALNTWSLDGSPQLIETTVEPSFIAKHRPYNYTRIGYGSYGLDFPIIPDSVGANPHFLNKYRDYILQRLPYFVIETSVNGPPPPPPPVGSGRYITEKEVQEALHKLYNHRPSKDTVYSIAKALGKKGGIQSGISRRRS